MSYLRYLCLFEYISVQHIVLCLSSSCIPYVASFSGFFISDCPFGFLECLLVHIISVLGV